MSLVGAVAVWLPTRAQNAEEAAVRHKVLLDYPQVKFTDYMSLLKIDGEWKIVNKTFHAEPKVKP